MLAIYFACPDVSLASSPLGTVRPSLSGRMARWGLVIVAIYVLVALLTPAAAGRWSAA